MANAEGAAQSEPPKIKMLPDGTPEMSSIADVVEWFLTYDERTARIRHPHTNELFLWKQADDEANGIATYPFENAEARFAIGSIQALNENNSEPLLKLWISDLLEALQDSHNTRSELTEAYNLGAAADGSMLERAEMLPSAAEKRRYLTSCWFDTLWTAEVRLLGWIYQEMYGRPFAA